jgi:fermentation-respiration switch protein FrsA (DUF1100 family)
LSCWAAAALGPAGLSGWAVDGEAAGSAAAWGLPSVRDAAGGVGHLMQGAASGVQARQQGPRNLNRLLPRHWAIVADTRRSQIRKSFRTPDSLIDEGGEIQVAGQRGR